MNLSYENPSYHDMAEKTVLGGGKVVDQSEGNVLEDHISNKKVKHNSCRTAMIRAHRQIFMVSLAFVIIGTVVFKLTVGSIAFHKSTMLRMMLLNLVVFAALEMIFLFAWVIRESKPFRHIVELLKGNWIYAVVCVLTAAVCFIPIMIDYVTDRKPYGYYTKEMVKVEKKEECVENIGPITKDTKIEQTFISEFDTITGISLSVATYGRENDCKLYVRLIDQETDRVLESWEKDAVDFDDDSSIKLESKNPMSHFDMRGKRCRIEITSSSQSIEQAVTLYYATVDLYKNGKLILNGQPYGRDLIMTIWGYDGKDGYERVKIWLCVYLMIAVEALLYCLRRKRNAG